MLQFFNPGNQRITVRFQFLSSDSHAFLLHIVEYQRQRHFHLIHEPLHARCLQLVLQYFPAFSGNPGSIAGIFRSLFLFFRKQCPEGSLSEYFRLSRDHDPQMLRSNGLRIIIIFQRIQQIGGYENIKILFGTAVVQRIVLTLYIKCSNPEPLHRRKFLQSRRDLCRFIHRLFHLFKQAQLTLRLLLPLQRIKYRFRIRHRYRRSQQFFLLCIGSQRRFRDQPQTDFFLFLGLF